MPESSPSLADQALARLRRLAAGNGLAPESILLIEKEEQTYLLEARLSLLPRLEVETQHYEGPLRSRKARSFASVEAMRAAAMEKKKAFEESTSWIDEAVRELRADPGEGWGHDDLILILPSAQEVWGASENCPACRGQGVDQCPSCAGKGMFVCPECNGDGRETCLECNGTGQDPKDSKKECYLCRGTTYMVCRHCQGKRFAPCTACMGRGTVSCPECHATGKLTEELHLSGRAEGSFRLLKKDILPSGFLRALGRLSLPNLVQGHGKVEMIPPKEDPEDKSAQTTVSYKAEVPFADMKIKFGNAPAALVSSFGLKGVLLGCPAFLDAGVKMGLEALKKAATDPAALQGAMKCRAVADAVALELEGRGGSTPAGLQAFRRLYPVGFSSEMSKSLLAASTQVLLARTRAARLIAAIGLFALGAALDLGFFFSPLFAGLRHALAPGFSSALSFLPLLLSLLAGWFGLAAAARLSLSGLFAGRRLSKPPRRGALGYGLMAALFLAYVAAVFLTPAKPFWLLSFTGFL